MFFLGSQLSFPWNLKYSFIILFEHWKPNVISQYSDALVKKNNMGTNIHGVYMCLSRMSYP